MRRHCHCRCPLVLPASRCPLSSGSLSCPICPPGPPGAAATITIGTVTTGAPGSPAQVTNSGTSQNAVLNFTIPQGLPGASQPVSLVSSYSTPPQPGASGTPLTFDRTSLRLGNDITQTPGSDTFTITQPGVYSVEFHGVISPTGSNTFPVNFNTSLEVNGSIVPGASVPFTFQNATQSSESSFTVPHLGDQRAHPPANRPHRGKLPGRCHIHHHHKTGSQLMLPLPFISLQEIFV